MNEDQTPQEIVAEVQEMVKTVWTTGAAPLTETDVREHLAIEAVNGANHEFRTFPRPVKAPAPDPRIAQLKNELRLKMAAKYGNRHDRRQAEAMGRKAATKAKHLAWKKASQKGTPVAATPLPSGAHQPGVLNRRTYIELSGERGTPYTDSNGQNWILGELPNREATS